MSTIISDTLPFAVAVAISPLPIIAVILILLSPRARVNGLMFLLGWFLGLAVAEGIALAAATLLNASPGASQLKIVAILRILVGAVLILFGVRQWTRRPRRGEPPRAPGWMRSLDTITPLRALGIATLLSAGGNLAIIIAAAVAIARANMGIDQALGALGIFIIVGSLTVAATLCYHLIAGDSAAKTLTGWKTWLLRNNATVMAITLALVGVILVGKGISSLGSIG